jgi:hypothetical protein
VEWRGRASTIEVEIGPAGTFGFLRIDQTEDGRAFTELHDVTRPELVETILHVMAP